METVRVAGASLVGTGAELVTVEARFDPHPKERTEVVLTGLPDPVIRESRGKLQSALAAHGIAPGPGRLFLNLVPAARKKSGEILDLPLAVGAAAACGHLPPGAAADTLFLGEVGIDGALHAVPGGLAAALAGRRLGLRRVVAPLATADEAACVPGVRALGSAQLGEVLAHLCGARPLAERTCPPRPPGDRVDLARRLDEVRGQAEAKLALAVAAAGGHGLLLVGPPGAGKSLLARRVVGLLPPPEDDERIEITAIHSAAGLWPRGLVATRPFRAPHHTASHAGLVGGGSPPRPGEITLAHGGVLFLDELPEFRREALEALRQPLESGRVVISRAGHRVELPARFQLLAAMNPCPCGWRGHARVACRCPPHAVERYRRRVSGPLLDRVDLRLELAPPELDELALPAPPAELAGEVLARGVDAARARARDRQGPRANADLTAAELDRWCPLDPESRRLAARATRARGLSARALQSLRRLARTLADWDGADLPAAAHLARALALRAPL